LNFRVRARGCGRLGTLATARVGPSLLLSSQSSLPRRPSFSLHLYDRFVQDNEISDPSIHYPINHSNAIEIEVDAADATSEVPPSADDAIVSSVTSLSSSPCITTPRVSISYVKNKNPSKRELVDDSHFAFLAKKPASTDSASSNNSIPRDSGRGNTSSSFSLPMDSRSYRYNNKDQPLFVI